MRAALLLVPLAALAAAQEPPRDRLGAVERALETTRSDAEALAGRAAALDAEIRQLNERLVVAARQVQEREGALADAEAEIAALEGERARAAAALAEEEAAAAAVTQGLIALARLPQDGLLLQPGRPEALVRGAILMRAALPELDGRAGRLRERLAALSQIGDRLADERAEAERLVGALSAERGALESLLTRRRGLKEETEAERAAREARLTALAEEAGTLRDLVERLEAEAKAAEAKAAEARRLAAAIGIPEERPPAPRLPDPVDPALTALPESALPEAEGLALPVAGRIVVKFGEQNRLGSVNQGLTIAARPGATVIAPVSGTVLFVGPFRSYGRILILEHGGRYHTLLAGLGEIYAQVSDRVTAGEPVGVLAMPADAESELYYEVRRDGRPIDPRRAMAERNLGRRG